MKKFLFQSIKFAVASILVGYTFWLWREGVLTTEDDGDPGVSPGKMLGLFRDYNPGPEQPRITGYGLYEVGFGVAVVGMLFLAGAGMRMAGKMTKFKLLSGAAPNAPAPIPGLSKAA